MNQELPRFTVDPAGYVRRDGQPYCKLDLAALAEEREAEALRLVALLNGDEAQGQPGRRIFADDERHDFLRPQEGAGTRRAHIFAGRPRDPGAAGRAVADAVGGMGPPRARSSDTLPLDGQ